MSRSENETKNLPRSQPQRDARLLDQKARYPVLPLDDNLNTWKEPRKNHSREKLADHK